MLKRQLVKRECPESFTRRRLPPHLAFWSFIRRRAELGPGNEKMAKGLAAGGFVAFAFNYQINHHRPDGTFGEAALAWFMRRPKVAGKPLARSGSPPEEPGFSGSPRGTRRSRRWSRTTARTTTASALRPCDALADLAIAAHQRAVLLLLNGGSNSEVPVEQIERMKQAAAARSLPVEAVIYPNTTISSIAAGSRLWAGMSRMTARRSPTTAARRPTRRAGPSPGSALT